MRRRARGSGRRSAEICTGVCTTATFRLAARVTGVVAADLEDGVGATAAVSLEIFGEIGLIGTDDPRLFAALGLTGWIGRP